MDLARADGEQSEPKMKSIGAWGRDAVAAYVTGVAVPVDGGITTH